MNSSHFLIPKLIQHPECVADFSLADWDLLVRQARRANLLGILFHHINEEQIRRTVPEFVFRHFEAQNNLDVNYRDAVKIECQIINEVLKSANTPLVLLKGAAYVVADLPVSLGRMFSDIDILVLKTHINEVEQRLKLYGWVTGSLDEYDNTYYRKWMHEIPPLHHIKRGTTMDVHHSILPETAKFKPSSERLFQNIVAVKTFDNIYVLSPIDMILHSMTHLFHEGELEHGIRDLIDLDGLLKHYSEQNSNFWQNLMLRANELDLMVPLCYGIRYLNRIMQSPIPADVICEVDRAIGFRKFLMDILFERALLPDHASCSDWFTPVARWFLYVRAHYLRMPLYLLVPHLLRKAYVKRMLQLKNEKQNKSPSK